MENKAQKWALVTGSSSGIGKSLAMLLAQRKYGVILHGRDLEKLSTVAKEITTKYSVKTKIIQADLNTQQGALEIIEKCSGLLVELLVNNAGFGIPGPYSQTSLEQEIAMVHTHILAPMILIKHFSKSMIQNNEGFILNVSSLYSFFPVPRQSIYGATKSFKHSFSLALYKEFLGSGISVCSLCPGLTYSNFRIRQGHEEKRMIVGMDCEQVARLGLKGLFNNRPKVVPGVFNQVMSLVMPLLPIKLRLFTIDKMNSGRGY